jgi:hypothetical protein
VALNNRRCGSKYGAALMDRHRRPPGQGAPRGLDGVVNITDGGRFALGDDDIGPGRVEALYWRAAPGPPRTGDELAQCYALAHLSGTPRNR